MRPGRSWSSALGKTAASEVHRLSHTVRFSCSMISGTCLGRVLYLAEVTISYCRPQWFKSEPADEPA